MTSPPGEKAALRGALLARRDALPRREARSRAIQQEVLALPAYRQAQRLLVYLSAGSEPDTWGLVEQALAAGKGVYAPRCLDRQGNMAFYQIRGREDLLPGAFGLWEPDPARCPPFSGGENCLCLVPGLAFDERGFRLGYGKGYYDRFLGRWQVPAAGLCFGPLLLPRLPRVPHDRRVAAVITEAGPLFIQEGQGKEECV